MLKSLTYLKAPCVLGGGLWIYQRALASSSSSPPSCHVSTAFSDTSRVLSQHEKYRKCHLVTTKLASLASESILDEFNQHYELLLELMGYWQSGKMAYVVEARVLEDVLLVLFKKFPGIMLHKDISHTLCGSSAFICY